MLGNLCKLWVSVCSSLKWRNSFLSHRFTVKIKSDKVITNINNIFNLHPFLLMSLDFWYLRWYFSLSVFSLPFWTAGKQKEKGREDSDSRKNISPSKKHSLKHLYRNKKSFILHFVPDPLEKEVKDWREILSCLWRFLQRSINCIHTGLHYSKEQLFSYLFASVCCLIVVLYYICLERDGGLWFIKFN